MKRLALLAALLFPAVHPLTAQTGGAERLHLLMRGLTVTPRVLLLGTQPEDADADLIAWLARGRMVETGYLSLTRGEGGENYVGRETGVSLGALRTEEALAARRIDGGRQFFTRAFDIGYARNADAVFKQWNRDTLLGQMVIVIRAFRPHVLVDSFSGDTAEQDGQHQALSLLARAAFVAAADSVAFPVTGYGTVWAPLKLYDHGPGLVIDANEFDAVLGRSYRDIAFESRAQQRTHGVSDTLLRRSGIVQLRRVATRVNEATPARAEQTLFDGIDTTFARLEPGFPRDVNRTVRRVGAYADSARAALALDRPAGVVQYLARAAEAAASVRINMPWCRHPAQDAQLRVGSVARCNAVQTLDLDASIDLVLRRVNEALFTAAGISIEARADRDLIGAGDSALVSIMVSNHGKLAVTLREITVTGSATPIGAPSIVIAPDSMVRVTRVVSGLADPHPWWISQRAGDFYSGTQTSLNGLAQTTRLSGLFSILGMAMPEDIQRTSDVNVLLDIAGAFVSMSAGPVLFAAATPTLGVRRDPLAEVPAITLSFERSLEWMVAGRNTTREFRVTVKSYSDSTQQFTPKSFLPNGLKLDSLPPTITLAPREQRILFLTTHGTLAAARHEFGFFGQSRTRGALTTGFRTIQYSYLPPVRPFRTSAMYLRAVNIEVPRMLSVAYVQGVGDDVAAALKQIGVPTVVIDPDDLLRLDLSSFSTIVIGPRAFESRPELLGKVTMLHDFARKGGTVVMMYAAQGTAQSRVMPFAMALRSTGGERVTATDAAVTMLDRKSRLLTWPNAIAQDDWGDWLGERALLVPTSTDAHYQHPLEMHDPGEPANRNTILSVSLGKGTFIYTTLTLPQQIALGVPSALRLLVNMLCASLVVGH